jgi:hypothetical protein
LRQAWQYFDSRYLAMAQAHGASGAPASEVTMGRFGPCGPPEPDGKLYHGSPPEHEFWVHGKYEEPRRIDNALRIVMWEPTSDTFCSAEEFCGHCTYVGLTSHGPRRYYCLGHDSAEMGSGAAGAVAVAVGVPLEEGSGDSTPRAVLRRLRSVVRSQGPKMQRSFTRRVS